MRKKPNAQESALFKQLAPSELRKGDIRKLQIVRAAIDSLAQVGWLGTNYETVGKLCGMKRPHVAYHYPKWDDLIESAIKFAYGTGQATVSDYLRDAPANKQLENYFAGTFHWLRQHPEHNAVISLLWHLATFDERFKALNEEIKKAGVERLYVCLFASAPSNVKDPKYKTALAVHGMLVGRCLEHFLSRDPLSTEEMVISLCESARSLARSVTRKTRR